MASNIFKRYKEAYPDDVDLVTNVGCTLEELDNAIDGHTHDGKSNPLIDQSVTLDFATNGGTIYVRTPAASSGQRELPDTSGLGDTYTKAAIDNKLAGKSNAGHNHIVSKVILRISRLPLRIRNP